MGKVKFAIKKTTISENVSIYSSLGRIKPGNNNAALTLTIMMTTYKHQHKQDGTTTRTCITPIKYPSHHRVPSSHILETRCQKKNVRQKAQQS